MNAVVQHVRQTTFGQIRVLQHCVLRDGRHFVKLSHHIGRQVLAAGSLGDEFVFDHTDVVIAVTEGVVRQTRQYYNLLRPSYIKGSILRVQA